ncbi:hypothetical protein T06_2641 [Trichinella sp. T6]|nr:hypothetical protein T06_2641 [Trichinella sp. T6]
MPLKIFFEKVPFYQKCLSFNTNKIFSVLLVESQDFLFGLQNIVNSKNSVHDGIKPFIGKKCDKIFVKKSSFFTVDLPLLGSARINITILTVAAQMFIAAMLSTPYAARSYFFVTFSSTKDAYSIDVFFIFCLLLTARLTLLSLFVQSLSLLCNEGIAGDWQPISEEPFVTPFVFRAPISCVTFSKTAET